MTSRPCEALTFPVYLSFCFQIDLVGDHDDREIILVLDLSPRKLLAYRSERGQDDPRRSPARSVDERR